MTFQQAIAQYNHHQQQQGLPAFAAGQLGVVLFDMDGVLYDSMPHHARAWHASMAEFGIRFDARDAYLTEGMRGVDTIRLYARRQQGKELTEAEAQKMYDEKTRLFHLMPQTEIFDGVLDLMEQIRQAGIGIGIVTGSGQKPLINRLVADFGQYVDRAHIVTAYDVTRGKPAPDPYLKGLQLAGHLQPWQGIVVENAPMGVRAGVAAGIFTIGVNTGPLPDSDLTKAGADILFHSLRELSDHFQDLIAAL